MLGRGTLGTETVQWVHVHPSAATNCEKSICTCLSFQGLTETPACFNWWETFWDLNVIVVFHQRINWLKICFLDIFFYHTSLWILASSSWDDDYLTAWWSPHSLDSLPSAGLHQTGIIQNYERRCGGSNRPVYIRWSSWLLRKISGKILLCKY